MASLVLCFVLLGGASAFAEVVKLVGEGRVTVQAEGVILINLLKELESVIPIEQILLDPAVDGKMVRVALEDVPFREAIEEILAAAEVNHVVWGEEGGPFRIFAGSAQQTRLVPLSERAEGLDRSPRSGGPSQTPDRPARPASGEAFLGIPPDGERFAATLAILVNGLLSGAWLLGPPSHRVRSRSSVGTEEPR